MRWINKGIAIGMAIIIGISLLAAANFEADAAVETVKLKLMYHNQVHDYNSQQVTIKIDDQALVTGDMPPVIIDNRTLVPVREVFESQAIGAKVVWNDKTQEVYVSYLDTFVVLKIDAKTAFVNGKQVMLDVPAMLIRDMSKTNHKTMIPLRFVSENLGFEVQWQPESFSALIRTGISNPVADGSKPEPAVDPAVAGKISGQQAARQLPTELNTQPVVFPSVLVEPTTNQLTAVNIGEPVVRQMHPKVLITDLSYQASVGGFVLTASDKITDVTTNLWDGKYILEIENSSFTTIQEKNISTNPMGTTVRYANHKDDSYSFVKMVFELSSANTNLKTSLSADRTKIYVTTGEKQDNYIRKISLNQDQAGDFITIEGAVSRQIKAFRMSEPNRLVLDIEGSYSLVGTQTALAKGQYVDAIRTSPFDKTVTRVVVETSGQPDYQIVDFGAKQVKIQFLEPKYKNISYENTGQTPRILIEKVNGGKAININNVRYQEDYQNRRYDITLLGDYRAYFGQGNIKVNDEVVESIDFKQDEANNTIIQIRTNQIREFRLFDTNQHLEIRGYRPTELYGKVLVVDAGHGGKDPGAVIDKYYEKDVVLSVTQELKKLLDQDQSIKVYYTRLEDVYPTLEERCVLANEVNADAFLSLHCNSFEPKYKGTETLYLPGGTKSGLDAYEMAEVFQKVFSDNTEFDNYKMKPREHLYVLNKTNMPAIILEMAYLSNSADRSWLVNYDYHSQIARAIQMSIDEMFGQYPTGR